VSSTSTNHPQGDPAIELHRQLGELLGGTISNLFRMSGGASRETWSFDCHRANGVAEPLILRRDPTTLAGAGRSGGMLLEARLFDAAAQAGLPVPQILASGDANPDVLETGFLVMTRVEGETIARKILRDEPYAHARSVLVRQLGEALGKLHAIPVDAVVGLEPSDRLVRYREVLDVLEYPSPTFEFAYRWLMENQPTQPRQAVVHGDYRLGNVIVNESGLAAVLDWELAHIGDPMEDLGWLCVRAWRFGGQGIVAGLGELEELYDGYRLSGGVVDDEAVHWWIVAGTLVWGIMCALQASAHTSGANQSVELAAIGRRVAEQEHDLLELLGAPKADQRVIDAATSKPAPFAAPTAAIDVPGTSVLPFTSAYGVPDIGGLLEAVQSYIDTTVFPATSGRVQFHARVASNVLATAQREIRLSPGANIAFENCYARFDVANEIDLARAVQEGNLTGRSVELLAALRETVTYRLAVANPKHFKDRM
jgi:aminoglycoside phosphotransferase (APT) family kinase protein